MLTRCRMLFGLAALVLWPDAAFGGPQEYPEPDGQVSGLRQRDRDATTPPVVRQAAKSAEGTPEPHSPAIVGLLNDLADLYRFEGNYAGADTLYRRSLAIGERRLGANDPLVVATAEKLVALARLRGTASETPARGGSVTEVYRGFDLIALPPVATEKYDVGLVDQRVALAKIREALDIVYRHSPSSADTLETLKRAGDVIILYYPSFPRAEYGKVTLAAYVSELPDSLLSDFPDVFGKYAGNRDKAIFLAVLGRYVVKHRSDELAGAAIVHELVGHGLQQFRGRLEGRRNLDVECEASLYELNAYQDFGIDKFSLEMIRFRRELENFSCDDFKRYMRIRRPSSMTLWDDLDVDVWRLLETFEDYANFMTGQAVPAGYTE